LTGLQVLLDELLAETGASRVTLRQDVPGETFPVTHEALSPEARSIRGVETPSMSRQPVVLEGTSGRQVVQDDCEPLFPDDAAFHAMRALYGGLRAQIVTPVLAGGEVVAIVSVHQLATTRAWSDVEVAACSRAAERLAALIAGPG
jgi:GAF domain-containing protein